jgi:hypothetical protein
MTVLLLGCRVGNVGEQQNDSKHRDRDGDCNGRVADKMTLETESVLAILASAMGRRHSTLISHSHDLREERTSDVSSSFDSQPCPNSDIGKHHCSGKGDLKEHFLSTSHRPGQAVGLWLIIVPRTKESDHGR